MSIWMPLTVTALVVDDKGYSCGGDDFERASGMKGEAKRFSG
jgi:hypothetical protein